jgi:hypothetical protein
MSFTSKFYPPLEFCALKGIGGEESSDEDLSCREHGNDFWHMDDNTGHTLIAKEIGPGECSMCACAFIE